MADKQNEQFGPGETPVAGVESPLDIQESSDMILSPESAGEKSGVEDDKAKQLRQRLETLPKRGQEAAVAGDGNDLELRKEKFAQKTVMDAVAAGEDIDAVQKIFEKAAKRCGDLKYMDEIHDRYIAARNEKSGGMY